MERQVKLIKKAESKLDSILDYLYFKFGPSTAARFLKRTYSFLEIVPKFPQIGKIEDKEKEIFGFVLEKPVTIFYRFTDKEVIILNFFDTRMNPDKRNE